MTKSIAHITLLPLEGDARVQRAINALKNAGFSCPVIAPNRGFTPDVMSGKFKVRLALTYGLGARLGHMIAERAFFSIPQNREAYEALLTLGPDAIHAHDWDGLIVGAKAAATLNVPFAYDSHELASHMHTERKLWSATVGQLIRVLEGPAIRKASFVIGISEGLLEKLQNNFQLKVPTIAVRNIAETPALKELPKPRSDGNILLHYHGILADGRGLEVAVEALSKLPAKYQLRLTGPWRQDTFKDHILSLVTKFDVTNRVEIVDPIPHEDLVEHASSADIGLNILTSPNQHNDAALPNKIFDYLKAGLLVISAGSSQLKDFETQNGVRTLKAPTAEALCEMLTSIPNNDLPIMRRNALELAQENDWPHEREKLVAAWNVVFENSPSAPSAS